MKDIPMYLPIIIVILMFSSFLMQIIDILFSNLPLYVSIVILFLDRLNMLRVIKRINNPEQKNNDTFWP